MRQVLLIYAGKFSRCHEVLDKGWRLTLKDIKRIRDYKNNKKENN